MIVRSYELFDDKVVSVCYISFRVRENNDFVEYLKER